MRLYFAYGSNLWREQMRARCPEHKEIGSGILRGYRWIISARGYANIVASRPDLVLGKIYALSAEDEQSLDRYEGVASGDYRKEMLMVEAVDGRRCTCLVYVDPVEEKGKPREEYVERIRNGIADAWLPAGYVDLYLRRFLKDPGM
jgi:gamma-glutamylcyclotransferase